MAHKTNTHLLATSILSFGLLIACKPKENMADRIVMVQEDNKEMDAAVKAAIVELPLFWERFSHPKPGDDSFSVKVAIKDQHGTEYFWLTDIRRTGATVSGIIDVQPQIVKSVEINQHIDVGIENVIDWLFMTNGKMKGNFTLRPIMKSIPKDDLDKLLPLLDQSPSIRNGA